MPDKNFLSFEDQTDQYFESRDVVPDHAGYNDTVKAFRCTRCLFDSFAVRSGTEDALDVGRESSVNVFSLWKVTVSPGGRYVVTCKGGSHYNLFSGWEIHGHGSAVDFEFGNWHSLNFEPSRKNTIFRCRTTDGSPITYAYRFGCKPIIIDTNARHLWWRSIGLTVYWWGKYIAHRVLRLPDNY
jgi:hypothetical protein